MVILIYDSNLLNWVKITHGLTDTGNTVSYAYLLYAPGKAFFPIILSWVKK